MMRNVGKKERYFRLAMALTAGRAAFQPRLPIAGRVLLAIASVAGLFTGTTRYCPVNQALGVGTPKFNKAA